MADPAKHVLVTGDIVLDHHIYEGERLKLLDDSSRGVQVVEQFGGAALMHELIECLFRQEQADKLREWRRKRKEPRKPDEPEPSKPAPREWGSRLAYDLGQAGSPSQVPRELQSYVMWKPFPAAKDEDEGEVWRIERPLGYGSLPAVANLAASFPAGASLPPGDPSFLLLDDAGYRFRRQDQEKHWHLPSAPGPWIVLKLAGAVGAGDLWVQLQERKLTGRLVIIVSIETLRKMDAHLNPALSWEQAAEQLVHELAFEPVLLPLRQCRHLIVNFALDGAVWLDLPDPEKPQARIVFDVAHVETEWSETFKGHAFGYSTCLAASIVRGLAHSEAGSAPAMEAAIQQGLSAMRLLHSEGHGPLEDSKGRPISPKGVPVLSLVKEILKPGQHFACAEVPWPKAGPAGPKWSILAASQGPGPGRPLFGFARQIALRGDAALTGVPHFRIGNLLAAGRDEMESLRILKRLMRAYCSVDPRKAKPLSIGVFGAPGAGKSFAVRELTLGLFAPGEKKYDGWMEFNLSQFNGTPDLIGALHQVRDRVLEGLTPVVFWDEFDSQQYRWLQYLLAPMQDNKFQEGQITHPIGKCVFIFAGATATSFEAFGDFSKSPLEAKERRELEDRFRLAKGPDFKSRLDAFLNVPGPNPLEIPPDADASAFELDPFCPIRRAIFLRAQLGCKPRERLVIDLGLLTALLEVGKYIHGSRSLEKMMTPLRDARKHGAVRRSQLASPPHLAMYVEDPEAFRKLCAQDNEFKQEENARTIAPYIHATWMGVVSAQKEESEYRNDFEKLDAGTQQSNIAAARRMPNVLALVGLRLEPAPKGEPHDAGVREHIESHIEILAEAEHDGWMEDQRKAGWRYSKTRDNAKRLHDCLVPYQELRDSDRNKDRGSVRDYPKYAQNAKWRIVFA